MKKLLCLLFVLTILGCSSNDDSNQTFRNIYSNTFWRVDGGVITFSNDKLFSLLDDDSNSMSCIYFKEGSYDNVDYDGCTYDNSLLSLIEETSDKLVFMQVTSNGTNNGSSSSCEGDDVTVTFEVLSDDLIRLTRSYDGVGDSLLMTKENSSFSFSGCVDGPSNGILL
jgi:hypothetical protein|tara:strand:+ start:174 stop:677 length:504 start_codon:yes stop_codon:yes gene_type:complete